MIAFIKRLFRRKPKCQHEFIYGPMNASGWAEVTCKHCPYFDIY